MNELQHMRQPVRANKVVWQAFDVGIVYRKVLGAFLDDWNGSVVTESAKVREQIRRPDFGHLEVVITVDDPKAYTKPWTVTLKQKIVLDTDLVDEICLENEKFLKHQK